MFEQQLKLSLDTSTESTSTIGASYPVKYTLQRPTNIIPDDTRTESLSAIKPTTLIATVGIFDPEADKYIDFRKFWDRLTDYVRNSKLYEHEYIHCLITLMKGSAADAITDMNKQYRGNLNLISRSPSRLIHAAVHRL